MAKDNRNDLLDRLGYLVVRLISAALHCFPVNLNHQTAKLIASIVYRLDHKHRNRTLGNLKRSFPDATDAQRAAWGERSAQSLTMMAVEVLFTTRLIRLDTWPRYVTLKNFEPVLELLLKRNQGLLMLTAHYGNFEILGYLLATLGFPTASVARPLDNPYISEYLFGLRAKMGQRVIVKHGATEDVVAEMEAHEAVGFVADQNAGPKGIFVDFFGRKASTYKSIGLVAMQYNVPVVIGYARRVNDEFRFVIGAQDIIYPDDWKDEPDPLRYITQRYTKAIEDFIRDDPGQYWWVHRRWKTRPKGEVPEAYD